MTKLKPCPFCGGEAYFDKDDHGWQWIECGKCHVATSQRASLMEDCKPLLAEAWNTRSAIDSEAKINRIEELETELESARKDRRIAWDDANKAEAALKAIDHEVIMRECAYKAKQAILSAPYDNPTRAYAAALAEAAIFSAEPAQDAKAAQKTADDRAYAWRHEMTGDDEPKGREAEGLWHTNQPTNDGLYLVEVSAKFSSPSPWYETAFYRKREGWTLPKHSDCEQVLAWMEIPSRSEVKRRLEEAEE